MGDRDMAMRLWGSADALRMLDEHILLCGVRGAIVICDSSSS